jgi:hypothetical protein
LVASLNYTPAFAAGRTNQSIANSILNGRGAPTAKIGINGDFYIDTLTFNMYGPKAKNRWPAPVNLRGPAGTDGKNGDKGQTSIGAEGARGPKGDTGPQGLKGEKGEKGDKGDVGERGIQGLVGLTGAVGPAGAKGDTGATGATGAAGLKGDKGDKGDAGIAGIAGAKGDAGTAGTNGTNGTNGLPGAKGDKGDPGDAGAQGIQGVQGPAGPSISSFITVPQFTLSTANPNTSVSSNSFGALTAGKSYKFQIHLRGKCDSANGRFGLAVNSGVVGDILKFDYTSTSQITEFRDGQIFKAYHFQAFGTIKVGSTASSLSLTMTDGTGVTGATAMVIDGSAVITLVEEV